MKKERKITWKALFKHPIFAGVVSGVIVFLITDSCHSKATEYLEASNRALIVSNDSLRISQKANAESLSATISSLEETIQSKNDTIRIQNTTIQNYKIRIKEIENAIFNFGGK